LQFEPFFEGRLIWQIVVCSLKRASSKSHCETGQLTENLTVRRGFLIVRKIGLGFLTVRQAFLIVRKIGLGFLTVRQVSSLKISL
jgi:hypothetical protein